MNSMPKTKYRIQRTDINHILLNFKAIGLSSKDGYTYFRMSPKLVYHLELYGKAEEV